MTEGRSVFQFLDGGSNNGGGSGGGNIAAMQAMMATMQEQLQQQQNTIQQQQEQMARLQAEPAMSPSTALATLTISPPADEAMSSLPDGNDEDLDNYLDMNS